MDSAISRRDFIIRTVGTGTLLTGMTNARANPNQLKGFGSDSTMVVARRNGTPHEMIDQCLDALGGIEKFVPEGSKVAIKVCGHYHGRLGNTSMEVVKQTVRILNTAHPSEITVFDHTIPGARPCYYMHNIMSAAERYGAKGLELLEDPNDYVAMELPYGLGLKSTHIAKVIHDADVIINLPPLKDFFGDVSIGLKNHMGSILYRGPETGSGPEILKTPHGNPLGKSQGIPDLNTCIDIQRKHRLTIVDALLPIVHGYGAGGTVAEYNGIIVGTDPVATDYIGAQVLRRYDPTRTGNPLTVANAAALGLGTNDPNKIVFDERGVSEPISELGSLPFAMVGLAGIALAYRSARSEDGDLQRNARLLKSEEEMQGVKID
jgi:uncharacterized protein (DUF362 family)